MVMNSHLADDQLLKIIALGLMMQGGVFFVLFSHTIYTLKYTRLTRPTLTGSFAASQ